MFTIYNKKIEPEVTEITQRGLFNMLILRQHELKSRFSFYLIFKDVHVATSCVWIMPKYFSVLENASKFSLFPKFTS